MLLRVNQTRATCIYNVFKSSARPATLDSKDVSVAGATCIIPDIRNNVCDSSGSCSTTYVTCQGNSDAAVLETHLCRDIYIYPSNKDMTPNGV